MVVSSNDTAKTYQTHAIRNVIYSDTCFLKVMGKSRAQRIRAGAQIRVFTEGRLLGFAFYDFGVTVAMLMRGIRSPENIQNDWTSGGGGESFS